MEFTQTKRVLVVKSSLRGDASETNKLISQTVATMRNVTIVEHDVTQMNLPHIDGAFIHSVYNKQFDDQTKTIIESVRQSDIIIVGCPLYNFGPPSILKAYIDRLIISGETFEYVDGVPKGLLSSDKQLIICYSSGATAMGDICDCASGWLKTAFGYIGITNVTMKTT